MNTGNCSW